MALAPAIEHVGDVLAISNVTGKDYIKKPGLHRTLSGDGVASMAAALFGGPPNTTYSEVTGAVMLTRVFNPVVMTGRHSLPSPWLLSASSVCYCRAFPPRSWRHPDSHVRFHCQCGHEYPDQGAVDLHAQRNLVIVAVTLIFGIGGMVMGNGDFTLQGISLCGLVAVILNQVLPAAPQNVDDLHEEQEYVDDLLEHAGARKSSLDIA